MKNNLVQTLKKLLVAFGGAEKIEDVKEKNLVDVTDKIADAVSGTIDRLDNKEIEHPIKFITFTSTEEEGILEADATLEEIFEAASQKLVLGTVVNDETGETEYLYLGRTKENETLVKFESFCGGLETVVYYDSEDQKWKTERV